MQVGLALGAGAARGLAHIGVLQVLEAHRIKVNYMAGTSIGAVIGGLYAADVDLNILERMAIELNWDDLVRITISRMGLISSERIYQMLRLLTRDKEFSELSIPTAVGATDISSGKERVISDGPVATGIRASLSIPGVFVPVEYGTQLLVDGALVNPVPADVARNLGADIVIGVDIGFTDYRGKVNNLADMILRTIEILQREGTKHRAIPADCLISPKLNDITSTQLNRASEIIERGRIATEAQIGRIKELLGSC